MGRARTGRPWKGSDDVTDPDGIGVPKWVCNDPQRRAVMSEITTVGLDLAKNVFQVHGADGAGRAVLRKKLRRAQVLEFFGAAAALRCGDGSLWWRAFLGP
jgi:hypothetical protein